MCNLSPWTVCHLSCRFEPLDKTILQLNSTSMKPVSDTEFQLLSVLSHREKSGLEVANAYEKEFDAIKVGTLYTTLRRLGEEGFVGSRDDKDDDGRVRYF